MPLLSFCETETKSVAHRSESVSDVHIHQHPQEVL